MLRVARILKANDTAQLLADLEVLEQDIHELIEAHDADAEFRKRLQLQMTERLQQMLKEI